MDFDRGTAADTELPPKASPVITDRAFNRRYPERHFTHELLEAVARCRARSGLAEITIDDVNALDRPTRRNRPITQRVLTLRALAVFGDLPQGRLANIEIRI